MDLQDGTIGAGIQNLTKEQREQDQFCFENVAGIIHRGPDSEIDYYRSFGYKFNCPILRHLDCCNKDFFADSNTKKLSDEDGEYHLVSMGAGMNNRDLPAMVKKIVAQKIHYHLYVVPYSWVNPELFRELYKIKISSKYFHLEKALPFNIVPSEIAKYDFGSKIDTIVIIPYRIYTWLEAGLPIVISDRFVGMKNILKSYKVGLSIKNEELHNLHKTLDSCDCKELRKNVLTVREKLSLDKNKDDLINFYDSVINTK
jgi:hypothetical protein